MCRLFGHSVQRNIESANLLSNECKDHRKTVEPILNLLPETFSLKQFKEIRLKQGQSANVKQLIHKYILKGKLVRVEKGIYRKNQQQGL